MNTKSRKIVVLIVFALIFSSAICLTKVFSLNASLSPNVNFYKDIDMLQDYGFDEVGKTGFVFRFNNKIWKFNESDFCNNVKNFEIDYELNKYKLNNNKNNKINTIIKLRKINIKNNIIVEYLFPNLNKKINLIKKYIEKPCYNADFKYFKLNNKIIINKEQIGIKIDFELFYENILNSYIKSNLVNIEIPIKKIMPEITSQELKKSTNVRASCSTSFVNSVSDRKHNIRQATKKINGQIVEPNESFSFNNVVGKRTEENGYRVAKIISQGEFVDGVGGGVCQVSTTLYNAVLLAGLKVESANKHSERIYYCKAGFDAMVNYGSSDLVFKNNTNQPIRIYANCDNDKLTISIFGESLGSYSYKLKSDVLDIVSAGPEEVLIDNDKKYLEQVEYIDEFFYIKKAKDGCTIKSYREVYSFGNLVKVEELRTDKYLPQNAVKVYGSKIRPLELGEQEIKLFG